MEASITLFFNLSLFTIFNQADRVALTFHFNMQDPTLDIRAAIEVIGYNIAAATHIEIISLTLCAPIGAWNTYSSKNFFQGFIYGDTGPSTISIKSICLLTCFLLAFSGFVQSVRYLNYANYLRAPEAVTRIVSKLW